MVKRKKVSFSRVTVEELVSEVNKRFGDNLYQAKWLFYDKPRAEQKKRSEERIAILEKKIDKVCSNDLSHLGKDIGQLKTQVDKLSRVVLSK